MSIYSKALKITKTPLLKSLYRARKKIEYDNDLYMDEEHRLLCEYYKKYQELSKKFNNTKTKITYNALKIESHILSENHEGDSIIWRENEIDIELLYNEYNKKFINRLYVSTSPNHYANWINAQNTFIKNLSHEELYTLRCHTHDGDVIINYFIKNGLNIDKDIDDINYNDNRKSSLIVKKKHFNTNRDFILFYHQIKKYLYTKNTKYKSFTRLELENYIKENYNTFEWNKILNYYIIDINNIFIKAPCVEDTLVFYRGVYDDYYLKNYSNGVFVSETLSSCTLDCKTAIAYASTKCCVMRIKVNKGCKIILIDNVSNYNEAEVLLPFNTIYSIDYPRQYINYYKTSDICPDDTKSKKIMVTDLSIITISTNSPKSPKSPK